MHKKIWLMGLFLLFIPIFSLNAATTTSDGYINYGTGESAMWYKNTFDNLALDFLIPNKKIDGTDDQLNAITIENLGLARDYYDISSVVVWADSGPVGFQGLGVDNRLGAAAFYVSNWKLNNLAINIPKNGLRIFVTIEVSNSPTDNRTVQLKIPSINDVSSTGLYDAGDSGIFLASKNNGPAEAIINNSQAGLRNQNYDILAPKTNIVNLFNNGEVKSQSFTINGESKDQGGSVVKNIQVAIAKVGVDGSYADAVNTGTYYSTWEYKWENITDGEYIIKIKSTDQMGNSGVSEIKATANLKTAEIPTSPIASMVSADKSSIAISKNQVKADLKDYAVIDVVILDVNGKKLGGKVVNLTATRSGVISGSAVNITDSNGETSFSVKSGQPGVSVYSAMVDSVVLSSSVQVEYLAVNEPIAVFTSGELVKTKNNDTVYLVDSGSIKPFPSAAVFLSWGYKWPDIKVADSLSNYSLGDKVKFRDGYLIKSDKSAAIYVVANNGEKRRFATAAVLNSLGYKLSKVNIIAEADLASYPTGTEIKNSLTHPNGALIKYAGKSAVYLLENSLKRGFKTAAAFLNRGYNWANIITVKSSEKYNDGLIIE